MARSLDQLLARVPRGRAVTAAEVAVAAAAAGRVLVVLDDDPTGTQSVAGLPVLLDWEPASLAWALGQGCPAVYVMTNSRSLPPAEAEHRNREVVRSAFAAAATAGVRVDFVSRSDSTLRGHFPLEPRTLAAELTAVTGEVVDGLVVVPAFPDAGRVTVGGIHYAGNPDDGFLPVGETEFARDATFGYRNSDLREWVAEKSGGEVRADEVAVIDLATLRLDPAAAVAILRSLTQGQPVVCDAVDENDLRLLALALAGAEAAGSRFVYRVGPPFVRAVVGQEARVPLTRAEVAGIGSPPGPGPGSTGLVAGLGGARNDEHRGLDSRTVGGLVVVGSHVGLTTRQVERLLVRRHPTTLELDVPTALGDGAGAYLAELSRRAAAALGHGNVVVRTSRTLVRSDDAQASLAVARRVSAAVVSVVRQVLAVRPPRFVVAKGGITSSDVAAHGLGIRRAMVRGPLLPGIVSLWEPMDGPALGIPYVVFAGNVGGPESLADVVDLLSPREGAER